MEMLCLPEDVFVELEMLRLQMLSQGRTTHFIAAPFVYARLIAYAEEGAVTYDIHPDDTPMARIWPSVYHSGVWPGECAEGHWYLQDNIVAPLWAKSEVVRLRIAMKGD